MYYLEMILGQFTSRGSVLAMQSIPILKGVGVAQQVGTTAVVSYYCSLIALTLFYMFKSFAAELPWSTCWQKWNDGLTNCIPSASTEVLSRVNATSSSELYFLWVYRRTSIRNFMFLKKLTFKLTKLDVKKKIATKLHFWIPQFHNRYYSSLRRFLLSWIHGFSWFQPKSYNFPSFNDFLIFLVKQARGHKAKRWHKWWTWNSRLATDFVAFPGVGFSVSCHSKRR